MPGFPCFSRLLGLVSSMLSKETANPGKCGKPTDSALSWVFFMYKKPKKREFFPWNSADVLAVFARVSEALIST